MHSSRAPAGVSCLHAQVINEMLNQWFNKTLFSIFSSQSLFFAFSSDVASPQSSTWGGVLRWHSHKPIVASWAVDYGDPRRKEVGAPWDKQNGPPGSSGTDSVGPVTPRGVRCCITSIPSIRGGGVEGCGGVHISGGATVGYSSPHPLWRSSTGQIYHRITPVAPVEPHYKIYHRITPTVAPVELILVEVAPVKPHYTTAAGNRDARAAKYTPKHSSCIRLWTWSTFS